MVKSKRVYAASGGESMTQQHFADAANINNIMARHLKTGILQGPGRPSGRKPMFTNLSGQSYHEMLCQVQEAQGQFMTLPAKIRKRFANNPEQLFRFLEDPANLPEAVELGIVDKDNLSPERKEQLDLVTEAENVDRLEFEEWKRNKRASQAGYGSQRTGPELEEEEPVPPKKKPRK